MDCRFVVVGWVALTTACFSEPPTGGGGTSEGGSGTTEAGPTSDDGSSSVGGGTTSTPDASTTDPGVPDMGCDVQIIQVAGRHAPVDLLLALDSSDSMLDQVPTVQGFLDELLVDVIGPSQADDPFRVVLATDIANPHSWCLGESGEAGGCTPPANLELALLDTNSSDARTDPFAAMVSALQEAPVASLRPASQKHVVVLTDGDTGPNSLASLAALRLQPGFLHARVHTYAGGPQTEGCLGQADNAAELSTLSGGVSGSLCPANFGAVLDVLPAPIASCIFPIPPDFDVEAISQAELVGGASEASVEIVEGLGDCIGLGARALRSGDGDPPVLLLCPDTCRSYQNVTIEPERTSLRLVSDVCL